MENLLISLILALLTALGAWVTKTLIPYLKSKATAQQIGVVNALVQTAVTAAEQSPALTGAAGEAKKLYVLDWLSARNINIDPDELDALIESAVYVLKNG